MRTKTTYKMIYLPQKGGDDVVTRRGNAKRKESQHESRRLATNACTNRPKRSPSGAPRTESLEIGQISLLAVANSR